ncbi:UPF0182 family membrane protein [Lutispora thermophila]|uniref:UPF0182 protein SAMN02745176_01627 n=1 Tax=Lutispora thermophila DSM 19022 TaxID=1122184 RepID=A0A1M6EL87_9FIRM|nr:UPF0182 family protein [Lutispora thermophila]SHI86189.1 hypothetical protein SAMN02745176_01627 [Lutispora thermophila DSM 19022]
MKGKGTWKIKGLTIFLVLLVIVVAVFATFSEYFIDYQWFGELGYREVFFKKLFTQIKFFIPSLVVSFVIFYVFLKSINAHSIKKTGAILSSQEARTRNKIFVIVSALISLILSIAFVSEVWYDFLIFMNRTPFNLKDPIFGHDIGFYIFTLPFLNKLYGFLIGIVVLFAIITVVFNAIMLVTPKQQDAGMEEGHNIRRIKAMSYKEVLKAAWKQLSVLGGIFFLLLALGFYLRSFELLYSTRGAAFGAGYADIHVSLPFYYVYIGISIITAVSFMISYKGKKPKLAIFGPLLLVAAIVLSGIVYTSVQNLIVTPNESAKEEKYIQHNIDYTNYAYGLDKVEVKEFSLAQNLTRKDIDDNFVTIENIPVNDYKPAKDIYNQIQGLKSYYQFNDIDIDRYMINGTYRQVFISARELHSENLPKQEAGNSVSWINRYLNYTHGYGIAMSPVNEVTSSGQPKLFIRDMPVVSDVDVKLERPQIYFGELTKDYVIVNTREMEFDYPSSSGDVENTYEGTGGIRLTLPNRLMLALVKGKMNFLLSQDISSDSRILLNRNILERVNKIAPFLAYDEDPYIVVSEGKLYWIIDSYTLSSKYPYSQSISKNSTTNYIRNSVKVVIDAYNGNTDFYIADESDPIIKTYANVFKTLFKPLSSMPEDLRAHLRYPQTLFDIQAEIYTKYHIKDAKEFYNKSDVWDIATQIYGVSGTTTETMEVESSYLIMKLPDSDKEEFILMVPYTPQGKNNMIAWFAVKNDGENYGQLKLYTFPPGKIVEGPMQIEGIISQDVAIGNAINLLQSGGNSQVIRGNMLIIPVEDSILYVEPIYLRASNASALPELKKVIVFYKNQVVMEDSLEKSLARIFPAEKAEVPETPEKPGTQQPPATGGEVATGTIAELIRRANDVFNQAQEAQRAGNWALYGEKINELKAILESLNSSTPNVQ